MTKAREARNIKISQEFEKKIKMQQRVSRCRQQNKTGSDQFQGLC
jgi:hypothetical protein